MVGLRWAVAVSCIARLIDLEGRTLGEVAVKDPPPHYLYVAVAPRICARFDPEKPYIPDMKQLLFGLERRDGGGTYIYRRETGPWG